MEQQTVPKTYKYKLKPTSEQEQAMEFVLRRCHELYNAALQERREAWRKCGGSVTVADQGAQVPAVKEVWPEYCDIHSQVLQDVLTRWIAPSRRSSAASRMARRRAIRDFRGVIGTTASPTSNSAMEPL